MARGTARALKRNLKEAIEDFSAAIELDPSFADSWKRRGQAHSAMDHTKAALADLKRCMELSTSKDQKVRGIVRGRGSRRDGWWQEGEGQSWRGATKVARRVRDV